MIKWQSTPKYRNITGQYTMVWNSINKGYQPIAKDLSNKDIKVIQRAWNDWLFIEAGVEIECPWKMKSIEYVEGIDTSLMAGMSIEDIIKQLKQLPKTAVLNETICLTFENYK